MAALRNFTLLHQPLNSLSTTMMNSSAYLTLNMNEGILEGAGDLFKKVHGINMFEYMSNDPTFSNIFNKAMVGISQFKLKGILEAYRGYEGLASLVDVGGGTGKCLHMITSMYPHIKVINYDLPHVIQNAPTFPGIEHVGGDMFSSVPTAEAIMLQLLKNCYTALPKHGKLIIITVVLLEEPESNKYSMYTSRIDTAMIAHFSSGKERTTKELESLCRKAGFSNFQVAFQGFEAVIESYK
ncbi:caffeic acid 3-O-methyltransferase 3-like [Pistacia vera]|uniref:caffeic acid 3-O-methyltransferase 3-like n=1 Tax=Pistacia vera TaxID=55513 RepID=UPI0012636C5E|nr:caffeic acid 3-O-methyltransferase 3-like [Pistacia vera]